MKTITTYPNGKFSLQLIFVMVLLNFSYSNAIINIVGFEAEQKDNEVSVKWTTTSEDNLDYFSIEKSADGIDFENMTTQTGQGNGSGTEKYEIVDFSPIMGTSYYRITSFDLNGIEANSEVIAVSYLIKVGNPIFYPNPGEGKNFDVLFNSRKNAEVHFILMDTAGHPIFIDKYICLNQGINNYCYIPFEKLSAGIYYCCFEIDGEVFQEKFIVN